MLTVIKAVGKDNFLKVLLSEGVSPVFQHVLEAPFHVNRSNRAVLELAEFAAALTIDGAVRGGLEENLLQAGDETVDVGQGSMAFSHTQRLSWWKHFVLFPKGGNISKAEEMGSNGNSK